MSKPSPRHFHRFSAIPLAALLAGGAAFLTDCSPGESYPTNPDSMFTQVVVPTLKAECQGCHFPGGNIYGAFPFDESRIVLDRIDEILIRLEDDSRKPLEHWKSMTTDGGR